MGKYNSNEKMLAAAGYCDRLEDCRINGGALFTAEEYILKMSGHHDRLEDCLINWESLFMEDYPEESREYYRISSTYDAAKNAYDRMVTMAYAKINHRES